MIVIYLIFLLFLGIYSFSQIDLNLTLFQNPVFLQFQKSLIQLGYFNRPESVLIFLLLISALSLLYLYFIFHSEKITIRQLIFIFVGVLILGLLSYPGFSHDIFNYMFDARLFAFHHVDPYRATALMFPQDDWTRFMNWTHRTYPYGPTFLPITIAVYYLGLNKFLLTLIAFKALFLTGYILSIGLIYRLNGKFGALLFGLNPLILIEVVVSLHLDILMLVFALISWFYFVNKRKIPAFIWLFISIGIKYVTALYLPVYLLPKISHDLRLKLLVGLSILGAVAQTYSREFLPHYLIITVAFIALLPKNRKLAFTVSLLSWLFLIIRYYPFLSTGVWQPIILPQVNW